MAPAHVSQEFHILGSYPASFLVELISDIKGFFYLFFKLSIKFFDVEARFTFPEVRGGVWRTKSQGEIFENRVCVTTFELRAPIIKGVFGGAILDITGSGPLGKTKEGYDDAMLEELYAFMDSLQTLIEDFFHIQTIYLRDGMERSVGLLRRGDPG